MNTLLILVLAVSAVYSQNQEAWAGICGNIQASREELADTMDAVRKIKGCNDVQAFQINDFYYLVYGTTITRRQY